MLPVDAVEAVQVFIHPCTAEHGQFTGGLTEAETRSGRKLRRIVDRRMPQLGRTGAKIGEDQQRSQDLRIRSFDPVIFAYDLPSLCG